MVLTHTLTCVIYRNLINMDTSTLSYCVRNDEAQMYIFVFLQILELLSKVMAGLINSFKIVGFDVQNYCVIIL